MDEWDKWRVKHREEGDPDNERLSSKERASRGLFGAVSNEYELGKGTKNRDKVAAWVGALGDDAAFNFESYADCFVSENLIRRYIEEKKSPFLKKPRRSRSSGKRRRRPAKGKETSASKSAGNRMTRAICLWMT